MVKGLVAKLTESAERSSNIEHDGGAPPSKPWMPHLQIALRQIGVQLAGENNSQETSGMRHKPRIQDLQQRCLLQSLHGAVVC